MPTVGEQLRRAREGRNLNLAQLAEQTKISRFYLEALEADQPERLPGPFFYKAFVKQYCKALGIDSKQFARECTERVGEETLSLEELRQAKFPARERDPIMRAANPHHSDLRFLFAAGGLIAVLIGGSVIYTWMQRGDGSPFTIASTPPAVIAANDNRVQLPVGMRPVSPVDPAQSTASQQQQQQQPSLQPAQQQQASNTLPGGASIEPASSVVNLTPNMSASDAAVSLSISANEPTWLMIFSDGKTLYQGILEPAQARILAGKANAVVKVGNAGGIQVKWNGKQIGPLGERGQVRMIRFTGTEWEFVRPAPKPSDEAAPSARKVSEL
jgi:cytoskeleton protein RodZ